MHRCLGVTRTSVDRGETNGQNLHRYRLRQMIVCPWRMIVSPCANQCHADCLSPWLFVVAPCMHRHVCGVRRPSSVRHWMATDKYWHATARTAVIVRGDAMRLSPRVPRDTAPNVLLKKHNFRTLFLNNTLCSRNRHTRYDYYQFTVNSNEDAYGY